MARRTSRSEGKRVGRPSKLTPDAQASIITAIRAGSSWADAAVRAGVGRSTALDWQRLGEEDDAPQEYKEFRSEVDHARADARVRMAAAVMRDALGGVLVKRITRIHRDGREEVEEQYTPPNGRIALEYLARTDPENWARRTALPVPSADGDGTGEPVSIDRAALTRISQRFHDFMTRDNRMPEEDGERGPGGYLEGVVLPEIEE